VAVISILTTASAASAQTETGSLVIYPKVEIKWDAAGNVIQDTVLRITNGYFEEVNVQLYFVNGDEPLPATLTERAHPGCNWAGCQIHLTRFQTTFWSALTGLPGACPFTVLEGGSPPGRPDPEHPGDRVLRGFIYAWAVDAFGREMNWNYLHGNATLLNSRDGAGWGYSAATFRALIGARGDTLPEPGVLRLDGNEYTMPPNVLLFDFFAAGEIDLGGFLQFIDTDLTLMPVTQDLRQETNGPITTKAHFDIINMDEVRFSGTTRCITCWDQTLIRNYSPPNNFLLENIHTDVGTARIDGHGSPGVCEDSVSAALLGVAAMVTIFPAQNGAADWNRDGTVDLADHRSYADCMTYSGPDSTAAGDGCELFDLDEDGDVDLQDFGDTPFGAKGSKSYSTIPLIWEGAQPAIIRYDAE
jgi:hypothetical protein